MAELLSIKNLNQNYFWSRNPPEGTVRNLCEKNFELGLDVICEQDKIQDSNSIQIQCKNSELNKSAKPSVKFLTRYAGIFFAIVCSFLVSMELFLAKILLNYGFDPINSNFYRYVPSPFLCIIFILYHEFGSRLKAGKEIQKEKVSIFEPVWPLSDPIKRRAAILLLIQAFFAPLTMIFRYFAVQHLSVGDASTISCSSPIFVNILAHFFLKEKTGIIPIFSAILTLVGVATIARPPILTGAEAFDQNTLIGTAYSCGSMLSFTVFIILTRRLCSIHYMLVLLVISIIGLTDSFALTQIDLLPHMNMSMNANTSASIDSISNPGNGLIIPHGLEESLLLIALAFSAITGQILINVALQIETAAIVSLVRTLDIVFGFLLQFVFLGVAPDFYSAVGGFVVFFGILIVTLRNFVADLPKDHTLRKFLSFLLF